MNPRVSKSGRGNEDKLDRESRSALGASPRGKRTGEPMDARSTGVASAPATGAASLLQYVLSGLSEPQGSGSGTFVLNWSIAQVARQARIARVVRSETIVADKGDGGQKSAWAGLWNGMWLFPTSLFCFRSLWASLLLSGLWHTCIPTHLGYGEEPDVARSPKKKDHVGQDLSPGRKG